MTTKKWQCSVCKYIHAGDEPPEKCPVCGVDKSKFVPFEDDSAADTPPVEPAAEKNTTDTAGGISLEDKNRWEVYWEKAVELSLKHHIHPISVHLPNGVIPVAVILFVLAWLSGSEMLAKAGFINLVFILLSLPLVGLTGFVEWQRKYKQAQTPLFKMKIAAASLTAVCCLISFIWYLVNPEILGSSQAWLFVLINLLMLAAAGVAGHMGGKLVFKE
ncbi:rubredoxin-like domain-containing protein [uncultured Desulfobacter sp.]|uniref:rubredoxin-like domain-containing protein n=1 Tax=uncultured Desulfobacter sp. TaxID=240139 RepID=UPI002AAA76DC|nr:DUF2231 domain-containing protein [uncultured Desulfobacter sp.]